ncbi:S66 peptidase family protein [Heyndrickxia acidicola]|uniref:LD-carboxypeptidase n=1 Tax=Heyndrickxia acidicola TaxID=209389 RepID=A0ABU6MHB5_9BACI|nr:LD-carboxypeptidase [Heyndrickxia acidicola]MED1204071.1 LD-carboxypeptidase [Heyndrickxia acidicola]
MGKGRPVKKGDTIGLTSPASPAKPEMAVRAITAVKDLGFKVKVGKSCFSNSGGYLAGDPRYRAQEINAMFRDPEITAIVCMRGGYGSLQILPYLNYQLIRENPKIFIGYSDITSVHTALQQECGLITIHGPMASTELVKDDPFTCKALLEVVNGHRFPRRLENPEGEEIGVLVPGTASGKLVGGNLAVLCSMMGTPFEINTTGKLLFLEDIHEEPYKIDRMLTQLMLAGKLHNTSGFVIGTWTDCEPVSYPDGYTVMNVVERMIIPLGKPAIFNFRAGHCSPMQSLPLGAEATLDALNGWLRIDENPVKEQC